MDGGVVMEVMALPMDGGVTVIPINGGTYSMSYASGKLSTMGAGANRSPLSLGLTFPFRLVELLPVKRPRNRNSGRIAEDLVEVALSIVHLLDHFQASLAVRELCDFPSCVRVGFVECVGAWKLEDQLRKRESVLAGDADFVGLREEPLAIANTSDANLKRAVSWVFWPGDWAVDGSVAKRSGNPLN